MTDLISRDAIFEADNQVFQGETKELAEAQNLPFIAETIATIAVSECVAPTEEDSLVIASWALGRTALGRQNKYSQVGMFCDSFDLEIIPGQPWVISVSDKKLALNPRYDTTRAN